MPRPDVTTRGRKDVDLPYDATEAQQRRSRRATTLDWTEPVDLTQGRDQTVHDGMRTTIRWFALEVRLTRPVSYRDTERR